MKSPSFPAVTRRSRTRGFALIVTLSLMILLTVIAVGLLTLSSVSLRSSSQAENMQAARSNARMALLLAIGDLQKQLGPDTRVSTTADQIIDTKPTESSTPPNQRQWAGAWRSWQAAAPADSRPAPEFLQWLVSGDPTKINQKSFSGGVLGTKATDSVEIVSLNTVGDPNLAVRVPLITSVASNGTKNNCAWWVSDLGTKGFVAPAKEIPTAIAETRGDQQGAPAYHLAAAASGTARPFQQLAVADPKLSRIATWQSSALLADKPQNIRGLFHDFTTHNQGLLTNVRAGGFRKDLSMQLERTAGAAPQSTSTALYTVQGETGINLQELWVYYNSYKTSELRRGGSATFTTGGTMSSGTPHFMIDAGPAACRNDDEFYLKQPVIISYQMAISLKTQVMNGVNRLHLVADPILTFWNPLDVPVVVPTSSFFSVKYWQIPYDLMISVNGGPERAYPMAASLGRSENDIQTSRNGDSNFFSVRIGSAQQLVFKPGEVIMVSQSGNMIVKSNNASDHALVAKAGFNYGGGIALPVRDVNGGFVNVNATDTITCKARPNDLTAGASATSGNSIMGKGANHTRHFSLTHHEYYVGTDRGNDSLGIGGICIDWDFGNRRLKVPEVRDSGTPGTKPSGQRLRANHPGFADIFKTITEARPLPAANLSTKQPVLLFSYNAKTETSSDLGTRCLSRFNPKALHVDFYDLSQSERDMLPYEYSVERLDSWKNRSLEVSTNGNGFFGGGRNASEGTSFVTTHSIPREPIASLAAFQHSFANGFDIQKPKYGYATLNSREPLLPQISHAIGNSMAVPMLGAGSTQGAMSDGRPMADHSYLANMALWDEWFLSGIAPQTVNTYGKKRSQKALATAFFSGEPDVLPVGRYKPDLRGQDPVKLANTYLSSVNPGTPAIDNIASLIRVDGMFNVNSTSVEAWKSLLGARKDRPLVIRDANGRESVVTGEDVPVANLMSPTEQVANGYGNSELRDPAQWTGRRTLDEDEIDALARAIVEEVRKRGPFLCLADFVNRRVGTDTDLARSGTIQSALDSDEVKINGDYVSGARAVGAASSRFAFPEAEEGPLSFGIPGIVKQADILTPIAPILSARSDSFLIRGYGEKTDASGKILARAWCEAVVQRSAEFVDPADAAEKPYDTISTINRTFGRRFDIVSFRWLSPSEA